MDNKGDKDNYFNNRRERIQRRNKREKMRRWSKGIGLTFFLLLVSLMVYIQYDNAFAYELKLDGEVLSYLKKAEILDPVLDELLEGVKEEYGEDAYFNHKLELEKVRDYDKDDLINPDQLLERLKYQVKIFKPAYIIKVDGIEMATLETEEEANLLLDQLLENYKKEDEEKDFQVLSVYFKQDVQVTEKTVSIEKIQSSEEAASILNEMSEEYEEYELKENENTWTVSRSLNIREADILAANPEIVPTRTRAGDKLRIPVRKALLEIISVERHEIEEDIDFEIEEKEDSSLYKGEKEVKEEGKKGKKKLITDITFLNGIERERNVIKEEVIEEASKKIVLIGTKEKNNSVATANNSGSTPNSRTNSTSSSGSRPNSNSSNSASNSTSSGSGTAPSYNASKGAAIVATAKKYLGVPYLYGGTSPSGFDCSGFTSYVYRQNGITLPRTSGDQANFGKFVAKDKLMPGDIVAFTGHVGIYIGGGDMIHASSYTGKVEYLPINAGGFAKTYRSGRRPY